MKTLLRSGVVLLSAVALFSACKSNDDAPATNSTRILGTWNKSFDAVDANGNGGLESTEKTNVGAGEFEYFTFNSNGTCKDSVNMGGVSGSLPGAWSINGDYLMLTILGDTIIGKITQLDANNLVVQDTSSHPAEWSGFTK